MLIIINWEWIPEKSWKNTSLIENVAAYQSELIHKNNPSFSEVAFLH